MGKRMSSLRTGWEQAAALVGHARSDRATDETRKAAQAALECLGPMERVAFVGKIVKQLPDIGQQMGKTDSEVDALVRSAKRKLGVADQREARAPLIEKED